MLSYSSSSLTPFSSSFSSTSALEEHLLNGDSEIFLIAGSTETQKSFAKIQKMERPSRESRMK